MSTSAQDSATADDFSSGFRKLNTKHSSGPPPERVKGAVSEIYNGVASWSTQGDFWNWGLHDEDLLSEIRSLIPGFDEHGTDGFSEQLYFQALRQVPVPLGDYAGKKVLEVGCGLGEGLNFVSRIIDASEVVGLDLSQAATDRANARLSRGDRLRFVQGDAEDLPFADGEFDVVLNVESSHNYPDLGGFLNEAARVLKPGGYLSHIDLFIDQSHELLGRIKQEDGPLEWVEDVDVTERVRSAIRKRLEPGSFYRRNFSAKKLSFKTRIMMGRGGSHLAGADFVGHRDVVDQVLEATRIRPRRAQQSYHSYRHHIARKKP
ncbi:class I SAM-dependent methyltransferase [Saccharopolyspora sp. TS4A08]|uniref:Class I SAM-dependent methyltransferase n=1 Tax=Saccharopolyspora ipomoeae TaxID=3042027 RepID=A0ABT6PTN6_9PSEU|nr:class I SAM-dependent methyltransferase [Saccharopolyspora sp. TS4A08]MDI2031356.1 class I SAM-dependent methyltransferase [Saccharopolyspora sp. TS4A08]